MAPMPRARVRTAASEAERWRTRRRSAKRRSGMVMERETSGANAGAPRRGERETPGDELTGPRDGPRRPLAGQLLAAGAAAAEFEVAVGEDSRSHRAKPPLPPVGRAHQIGCFPGAHPDLGDQLRIQVS